MARTDQKFVVMMPDDVKAFITAEAMKFGSSQNSEVIRCIRERMSRIMAEELSAATP